MESSLKWKYKDILSGRRKGNDAFVFADSGSRLCLSGFLPAKKAAYKDEKAIGEALKEGVLCLSQLKW